MDADVEHGHRPRMLTVLVPQLDYEDVRASAKAQDLSIAQWVRRAVREKLDRETA